MKVYVNEMLVKSKKAEDHVKHLDEMFKILRKYQMKWNPQKCVFGVGSGSFWDSWSISEVSKLILKRSKH